MAYEALARKYRPRTFDELVGQRPIVRTLTNALKAGRIHHAYVFSGVRGVGKTTVARVFAKALNCEKGPTPAPCLECPPCVEIAAGQDMDVIEMDAASRTGVEDVRDLIDTTRYAPARDRYKIFIIDEFHMLSRPAFNALLKTLEEPPPRVVFVMATTELHKVPSTVLSRTQQFDFRKVPVDEIADLLARIASREKIVAPRACLEMLARAGDGSVRDAESLLDQAIASCGTDLNEDDLRAILGLVPDETVEAFFGAAAERDAGRMVRLIDATLSEGHDLRVFLAGLIEGVRRLLLIRTVERASEILGLPADHENRLGALAERFDPITLLRISSLLMGLEGPLKFSDQPRFLFEAAAIRLATIADLAPIEDLIARLDANGPDGDQGGAPRKGSSGAGLAGGVAGRPRDAAPAHTARPARRSGPARSESEGEKPPPNGSEGSEAGAEASAKAGAEAGAEASAKAGAGAGADTEAEVEAFAGPNEGDGLDSMSENLFELARDSSLAEDRPLRETLDAQALVKQFVAAVHARKMPLAILVDQASTISFSDDRLVLLFEDANAFARKSVEQPANVAILKEIAAGIFGRGAGLVIAREADHESASPTPPSPETAFEPALEDDAGAVEVTDERGERGERGEHAPAGACPEAVEPPGASAPPEAGEQSAAAEAKRRRLLIEAAEDPVIKNILERFEGRIIEVKEVS